MLNVILPTYTGSAQPEEEAGVPHPGGVAGVGIALGPPQGGAREASK